MKKILLLLLLANGIYAQWQVIDSVALEVRIPAKKICTVAFKNELDSLEVRLPDATLTQKALQSIAYAPSWMKIDLEDRFSGLSSTLQDKYAQILLDAKDPYVDEVAFSIAHLSPEILTHNQFYSDIILENAKGIYSSDSVLDYVEVVNTGSAAAGGDYFSTTRYRVDENGNTNEYSMPRDIYYWYIVHPKLQGEMVSYISTSNGNPTAPPTGKFWRTYIFNYSEGQYAALRDYMAGVKTLWNCKTNAPESNGALGRLVQWCNTILPWGTAVTPRIPQPVWLYHQHTGTCSEHGWFANAAARCVLIPSALTKGARFDHKWNEFYERGWKDWEPINGWINRQANDYWGDTTKILNGCFNWRGDGFIGGTTEHYSAVCTLNVSVTDANDRPVDGAAVTIDAPGVGGPFCMVGWTGSAGFCRFLLGDKIAYFSAAIQSSIGSKPAQNVISNSQAGSTYSYAPKLSGAIPQVKAQPYSVSADTGSKYRIDYTINAGTEIVYGKHEYSFGGYSFPCSFADSRQSGTIDFFICDEDNFSAYTGGNTFNATGISKDAVSVDSSFIIPLQKVWYAVLSNEDKAVNSSVASVKVKLLKKGVVPVVTYDVVNRFDGLRYVSVFPGREVVFYYSLTKKGPVSLNIYDSRGVLVESIITRQLYTGMNKITWNTHYRSNGIYYYRFTVEDRGIHGKLVVIK